MRLEERIKALNFIAELGNYVEYIKRLKYAIEETHELVERFRLEREVRLFLEHYGHNLTKIEIKEIKNLLSKIESLQDLTRILKRLKPKPKETYSAGKTNCSFYVKPISGKPFGILKPIIVSARVGRGEGIKIANPVGDYQMSIALTYAYSGLISYLFDNGLNEHGYELLGTYDIDVSIGNGLESYEGSSLALPTVISIISALLAKPVDSHIAFTGRVEINGEIKPVSGIKEKLEICFYKNITTVYLPQENLNEVPASFKEIVIGLRHLSEVIENIFGKDAIIQLISELNTTKTSTKRPLKEVKKATKGERILISTVGRRDPYGAPYERRYQNELAEGPILCAFRKVMPRAVLLMTTPELTTQHAEETVKILKNLNKDCLLQCSTVAVDDPTVYDPLFLEMKQKIIQFFKFIKTKIEPPYEIYVSISSGTPQMHVIMLELMRKMDELKGAHLIQVREPRFVKPGETRTREIYSHHLGVGVKPQY